MHLYAGTSGFAYPEWIGSFYPTDVKKTKLLAYYASQLPSVEINNTFYRMPAPSMLQGWLAEVPAAFRFVVKAPKQITQSSA